MYFVYTLSFNKKPFYVGVTANPVRRYIGHMNTTGVKMGNYLYPFKLKLKFPDLNIVSHTNNRKTAYKKERVLIKKLIKSGENIINKGSFINIPEPVYPANYIPYHPPGYLFKVKKYVNKYLSLIESKYCNA